MRTLRPNPDAFKELRGSSTDRQLAARLGVSPSTLSRVLAHKSRPSAEFIAETLVAVPVAFDALFDVVDEGKP